MLKTILSEAFGFFIGALIQYEYAVYSMAEGKFLPLENAFAGANIFNAMREISKEATSLSLKPTSAKKRRFTMQQKRDLVDLFVDA